MYSSFFHYTRGVYIKPDSDTKPVGGHAIKIVGWGVEPGPPSSFLQSLLSIAPPCLC